jgi:hypothetical protein
MILNGHGENPASEKAELFFAKEDKKGRAPGGSAFFGL